MNQHFIRNIEVKKVRHHKKFSIHIDDKYPKHVIFTGKNGSGKTSLLEGIKSFLELFDQYSIPALSEWRDMVRYNERSLKEADPSNVYLTDQIRNQIIYFSDQIDQFCKKVELDIKNAHEIHHLLEEGKFLIAYFNATRTSSMLTPNGVEKVCLTKKYPIQRGAGDVFIKYLVDLKTQAMFARQEGDLDTANRLDEWFAYIEYNLKYIFENDDLTLHFDYKNYNFLILEPNKEPYDLTRLSSGFSSIFSILAELIMRMESSRTHLYDVEGIVIIDEIEAHLHVSLQKKIFKFLTDFFPKVQFIISTHSPFVLSSVNDAIIYDLYEGAAYKDLSNYSYEAIVEDFLGVDQYSSIVKESLNEYENLMNKSSSLSQEEEEKVQEISTYLDNAPDAHSNELKLKKSYIDLQRILRGDNI
ncbi:AAA family ATPase [Bacillus wiedmannii]|uniref:AAA family ATPase n=1 Tax=Bacillus wiedmannii TaxID=1890302 RepID=UPI000863D6EF|nr:AAA family ATPase [Bacillus wiedmannii]SCN03749.1 AAA ATPase [Bacillus wiedmannii]